MTNLTFTAQLIHEMSSYGLHIDYINLQPGIYHRFSSADNCKNKCCEYRIFDNQLGAHFKCFRRNIDVIWFAKNQHRLTYQERQLRILEHERLCEARETAQAIIADKCERFFIGLAVINIKHAYVQRKLIIPYSAKLARNILVIPVRDIDYKIKTLQFIHKNGFKKFKKGCPATSAFAWLSEPIPENFPGVIRICEGWSTGCTIRSITHSPVFCALSASNINNIAVLAKRKYKHAIIKICADNDQWGIDNTGVLAAKQTADSLGLQLYYPEFLQQHHSKKPTDFNDLLVLQGPQSVKEQLILSR